MPIQGQLKGKIPKQQTQQLQENNEDNKELLRKNSAVLENLNLMYETIHNETQLLKNLTQQRDKSRIAAVGPNADISAGVSEEPPIFEKKQEEPKKKTNKSMIPLFKKKPQQPAPALLPRWK